MLLLFVHGPMQQSKMNCQLACMCPGSCLSSAAVVCAWAHAAIYSEEQGFVNPQGYVGKGIKGKGRGWEFRPSQNPYPSSG